MTRRPIELLGLVTLGAAWGLIEGSPGLTFAGAAIGAVVWSAWDAVRAARLLAWLNNFDLSSSPRLNGLWLEMYDRSRKIFKKLEKQRLSSDIRLSNFLAAIQASPNGVVLLDDSGRIEWVNLTAANQLDVDPRFISRFDFNDSIVCTPHTSGPQGVLVEIRVLQSIKKRHR